VLRYDKRTLVYSDIMDETYETLTPYTETIDDAVAAVKLLENMPEIDSEKIFITGFSLGAMLAPRIAAEVNTAGLILLSGPTRPLEDVILEQRYYLAKLDDTITSKEAAALSVMKGRVELVKSPNLSPSTPSTELPFGIPAGYWLDLHGYRPAEAAKNLKVPMLIIQGERDYEVTKKDFDRWQRVLGGRSDVTFKLYPALNHLLLAGEGPGKPAEYNQPGNVLKDVIEDIAEWLTDN
jgi:dienelactone hydrolase